MNDTAQRTAQAVQERPLSLCRRPNTTYLAAAEGLDVHLRRKASGATVVLPAIAIAQRTDCEGFTDCLPVVGVLGSTFEATELEDFGFAYLGVTARGASLPDEEARRGV